MRKKSADLYQGTSVACMPNILPQLKPKVWLYNQLAKGDGSYMTN